MAIRTKPDFIMLECDKGHDIVVNVHEIVMIDVPGHDAPATIQMSNGRTVTVGNGKFFVDRFRATFIDQPQFVQETG